MYKDESGWEPQLNEERILKREPNNVKDTNAVAVVRPREQAYHQELSTQEHPNTINKNDEIIVTNGNVKWLIDKNKILYRGC